MERFLSTLHLLLHRAGYKKVDFSFALQSSDVTAFFFFCNERFPWLFSDLLLRAILSFWPIPLNPIRPN